MIGIYKIVNPKGKIYIGQSRNIENRWKYYTKLNCKGQRKLYYSLLKYGAEAHIFSVQEECKVESLNEREKYWQEHYNVLAEGLNLEVVQVEVPHRVLSEETRQRMSNAQKGKVLSEITKKKISESRKAAQFSHSDSAKKAISDALKRRIRKQETIDKIALKNRGQKRTNETRNRIAKAKTGKKDSMETKNKKSQSAKNKQNVGNPHSRKAVQQFSLENLLIRSWESLTLAAKANNTSVANISIAIKTGKPRVGYLWKTLHT